MSPLSGPPGDKVSVQMGKWDAQKRKNSKATKVSFRGEETDLYELGQQGEKEENADT